jgi:hypothetical protein
MYFSPHTSTHPVVTLYQSSETGNSNTTRIQFNFLEPPLNFRYSDRRQESSLTVLLHGIAPSKNGLFLVLLRLTRSNEEAMNDVSLVDLRYTFISNITCDIHSIPPSRTLH